MAARTLAWLVGSTLIGSAVSVNAMADTGPLQLYNPLGVYVGAGVGRSTINEIQDDTFGNVFQHLDGQPLGWNAVVGLRPIPILGAEAEFIDFGSTRIPAGGPFYSSGGSTTFIGGDSHERAAALFAVGYLPLPIPWLEPFAKLGWAQLWEHDSYSASYDGSAPVGVSQTTHPSGTAYGGGIQFHFEQLGVRAQYERISGERAFGGWNNPALLSVGLNWTF